VADAALAPLRLDERLDHAVRLRLLANPAVGQNCHAECVTGPPERINLVRIISVDEAATKVSGLLADGRAIRAQAIHSCAMFVLVWCGAMSSVGASPWLKSCVSPSRRTPPAPHRCPRTSTRKRRFSAR